MYSLICRKVHDSRFTLGQIQESSRRARQRLDHQRVALPPELFNRLLFDREHFEHQGENERNRRKTRRKERFYFLFQLRFFRHNRQKFCKTAKFI